MSLIVKQLLFIRRFLGIDAVNEPISRIGSLLAEALYVRDLDVDVMVRAIGEVFNDG